MQNLQLLNISLIYGSLEKSNAICIGLTHSCQTISHYEISNLFMKHRAKLLVNALIPLNF